MPRTSKIEYERRINTLQQWLVEGDPASEIHARIINNQWCTTKRHAQRLIAAAYKRWADDENKHLRAMRKIASHRLREMIKQISPDVKDKPAGLRAMLEFEKEINKLEGIMSDIEPEIENIITIDEML